MVSNLFQLCCSIISVVHGARLDMTEFMNWGGRVSCPTNSFFRVQLFIQGTDFLPNKQLFSSLKIRRCMISWMKCWARKSPAYVKNLGNIRSEIHPFRAAENPRIIRMGGSLVA